VNEHPEFGFAVPSSPLILARVQRRGLRGSELGGYRQRDEKYLNNFLKAGNC
jgi:hypothetical protein